MNIIRTVVCLVVCAHASFRQYFLGRRCDSRGQRNIAPHETLEISRYVVAYDSRKCAQQMTKCRIAKSVDGQTDRQTDSSGSRKKNHPHYSLASEHFTQRPHHSRHCTVGNQHATESNTHSDDARCWRPECRLSCPPMLFANEYSCCCCCCRRETCLRYFVCVCCTIFLCSVLSASRCAALCGCADRQLAVGGRRTRSGMCE